MLEYRVLDEAVTLGIVRNSDRSAPKMASTNVSRSASTSSKETSKGNGIERLRLVGGKEWHTVCRDGR